ncbi:MAG: hypothetical protein Q9190_004460, partial [Brigantiaea leucoxantha]
MFVAEVILYITMDFLSHGSDLRAEFWARDLNIITEDKKWQFSREFPHLKRLIINFKNDCQVMSTSELQRFCTGLAQCVSGLDWLHVSNLNDERMVKYLEPMVSCRGEAEQEHHDRSLLQTRITSDSALGGWKHVTLWQGSKASSSPFQRRPWSSFEARSLDAELLLRREAMTNGEFRYK